MIFSLGWYFMSVQIFMVSVNLVTGCEQRQDAQFADIIIGYAVYNRPVLLSNAIIPVSSQRSWMYLLTRDFLGNACQQPGVWDWAVESVLKMQAPYSLVVRCALINWENFKEMYWVWKVVLRNGSFPGVGRIRTRFQKWWLFLRSKWEPCSLSLPTEARAPVQTPTVPLEVTVHSNTGTCMKWERPV